MTDDINDRIARLEAEVETRREFHDDLLQGMQKLQGMVAAVFDHVSKLPHRVGTDDLMIVLAKDRTRVRGVEEQFHELRALAVETHTLVIEGMELLHKYLGERRGGDAA